MCNCVAVPPVPTQTGCRLLYNEVDDSTMKHIARIQVTQINRSKIWVLQKCQLAACAL